MANYSENYPTIEEVWYSQLALSETPLYGSSRVGIAKTNLTQLRTISVSTEGEQVSVTSNGGILSPEIDNIYISRTLGNKMYELSNPRNWRGRHLGNVLSTVSDRKFAVDTTANKLTDYYLADVLSYSDYYPFGMAMPGRQFNAGSYRYGFQNQETDPEMFGGAVAFTYRVHDPRIGRFLSVDPLSASYPHNSPYAFAENDVIRCKDLEGLEKVLTTFKFESGKPSLKVIDANVVVLDAQAPREEIIQFELDKKMYTANSYFTLEGRDIGGKKIGDFTGVRTIEKPELEYIVAYASFIINDVYKGNVEGAVARESNAYSKSGKELDFKNKAYELLGVGKGELLEIDGVTYNANEAGNYIWALVLEFHGVLVSANTIAEAGSQIQGRSDEAHEQKAISQGRLKAISLLKDKGFAKNVLQKRLEFRSDAKEKEEEEEK